MPIWIPIVIALVLLAGGGAAVALNWDAIVIAWKGKKLAVLGARAVGKTHLIRFLTTGSIPTEYRQTVGTISAGKRRFDLRDLNLTIKDTLDVSGAKDAYAEWKRLHDESDLVLYLLRTDHLLGVGPHAEQRESTETRVRDDLKHIGKWLDARPKRPPLFIIGTHCDYDPDHHNLSPETIGDYTDKFRRLPVMAELVARAGGASDVRVIIGTMKDVPGTEVIVYELFRQLQE